MRPLLRPLLRSLPLACCVMLIHAPPVMGDDDDVAKAPGAQAAEPSLSAEQQRAVGIVVARPLAGKTPQRIAAFGVVLDPTTLVSDMGETTAAAAAEQSASAELTRLQGLYKGGAAASLKMLEAARTDQAKAQAESQSAAARFALHWSPVAGLPVGPRQRLLQDSAAGRTLLLRADLPGRHSMGELPGKALLDVDGIQVPGHILGTLRQTGETQSVGVLIEVTGAPVGLGPGARVPVALMTSEQAGMAVPRDALLYNESGAYVYKQLAGKAGEDKTRYAAVKVTLLVPYGEGWLVKGVDDDDDIVVRGAGVLWSLQGVGAHAADDDDD
jgi:hypothetical protein